MANYTLLSSSDASRQTQLGTVNRVFCSKSVKHTNVNVNEKSLTVNNMINQAVTLIDFKKTHPQLYQAFGNLKTKGIWFVWGALVLVKVVCF
jgi:hypothetical protein